MTPDVTRKAVLLIRQALDDVLDDRVDAAQHKIEQLTALGDTDDDTYILACLFAAACAYIRLIRHETGDHIEVAVTAAASDEAQIAGTLVAAIANGDEDGAAHAFTLAGPDVAVGAVHHLLHIAAALKAIR